MSLTRLCACLALAVSSNIAYARLNPTKLTGAWSVTEIRTTGPNAKTIRDPQPGLLIFTGTHYSLLIITSDHARSGLPNRDKSTARELLEVWGPLTAASGTYEISQDTLTTRPMVAKNPEVMAPGNIQVNTFKVQGKTLTITRVRNGNNPVANPTTITFTRVE